MTIAEKLAKLRFLKEEMDRLESDPVLQQERALQSAMLEAGNELGITSEEDIAEILAPSLIPGKTRLMVSGVNSMPSTEKKVLKLYEELKQLEAKVKSRLATLANQPIVQQHEALAKAAAKHDLTPFEAAMLVSAKKAVKTKKDGGARAASKSSRRQSKQRPMRYWRNPHTGETIGARSTARVELKRWALEHGKQVLTDWEITEEEAAQSS